MLEPALQESTRAHTRAQRQFFLDVGIRIVCCFAGGGRLLVLGSVTTQSEVSKEGQHLRRFFKWVTPYSQVVTPYSQVQRLPQTW